MLISLGHPQGILASNFLIIAAFKKRGYLCLTQHVLKLLELRTFLFPPSIKLLASCRSVFYRCQLGRHHVRAFRSPGSNISRVPAVTTVTGLHSEGAGQETKVTQRKEGIYLSIYMAKTKLSLFADDVFVQPEKPKK